MASSAKTIDEEAKAMAQQDDMLRPRQLCGVCRSVLSRQIFDVKSTDLASPSNRVLFMKGRRTLFESARGCPCCYLIWSSVKSVQLAEDTVFYALVCGPRSEQDGRLVVDRLCIVSDPVGFSVVCWLDCFADIDSLAAQVERILGRKHLLELGDMAIMRNWIEDCFQHHEKCRRQKFDQPSEDGESGASDWNPLSAVTFPPPEDGPRLPPRIIDIGSSLKADYVRLVESHGQRGHYATLTYAWGNAEVFKTNIQNYQSHLQEIFIPAMNRVFRDAINTAREIGFRHLWIDAMCILQGSEEDWNRHAELMSDIYSNSALTLSASGAHDADAFIAPIYRSITFTKIPYVLPNGTSGGHYYIRVPAGLTPNSAVQGRLSSRGWCLQERILSRRIVHFSTYQLQWECRTRFRSENDFIWIQQRRQYRMPHELRPPRWASVTPLTEKVDDDGSETDSIDLDYRPWDGYSISARLNLGEMFSTCAVSWAELSEKIIKFRQAATYKVTIATPAAERALDSGDTTSSMLAMTVAPMHKKESSRSLKGDKQDFGHEDNKKERRITRASRDSKPRTAKFPSIFGKHRTTKPSGLPRGDPSASPEHGESPGPFSALDEADTKPSALNTTRFVEESSESEASYITDNNTSSTNSIDFLPLTVRKNVEQIQAEAYDAWYRMVSEYSRRHITLDKDRLPAIAGLAQQFATVSQDRYVAGLWAGDIAYGLLWERGSGTEQTDSYRPGEDVKRDFLLTIPSFRRACSWSWAALDGPRRFFSLANSFWTRRRTHVWIKDFSFGAIEEHERKNTSDTTTLTFTGVVNTAEWFLGYTFTRDELSKTTDYSLERWNIVFDAPENDPFEGVKETLYLLPIQGDHRTECLLLHATSVPGTYRRVGMGSDIRLPQLSDHYKQFCTRITLV